MSLPVLTTCPQKAIANEILSAKMQIYAHKFCFHGYDSACVIALAFERIQ